MGFSVSEFSNVHNYEIEGVSYAGRPLSNTAMFVTKKVEHLLENLKGIPSCLVFAEDTIDIPEELVRENVFVKSPTPQKDYAEFVQRMWMRRQEQEAAKKYTLMPGGYYVGEDVEIGENSVIEPLCLIGHGVKIGNNALIKAGAKIRYAVIGDNFIAGENCTVGTFGFTMADDDNGNKIRIPTLGGVRIGDDVEVGAHTDISCGSAGNTVIGDHVKIDAMVHIGHDGALGNNVEITAGSILGGFNDLQEGTYIGLNATTRNRISFGESARVSMGAAVTQDVPAGTTVTGNFAIPHQKFMKNLKESIKE